MSTRATEAESVLKEHMGYLPVSEMERRGVFPHGDFAIRA